MLFIYSNKVSLRFITIIIISKIKIHHEILFHSLLVQIQHSLKEVRLIVFSFVFHTANEKLYFFIRGKQMEFRDYYMRHSLC